MGLLQETLLSLVALATVLLQALLDAFMPGRESNRQRAERLQQDLNRYHGRDRAKRLEKELLLQRRKYDALVSMFTRAKDELQRMEKSSNSAQGGALPSYPFQAHFTKHATKATPGCNAAKDSRL
jgi:hypothetical protein